MAEKEYIEREAILNTVEEIMSDYNIYHQHRAIKKRIKRLPAAGVAPVRHGHWIECNYGLTFECSECKYPTEYSLTDYCPNCGAKMDGDKNG